MSPWNEATVHANGIDIHYWRTGQGSGKPVLLCAHGLTDNGRCWSLLAQHLEAEYDLIMPDARGHGLSGKPDDPFSYRAEDRVADALALLDALGIAQVFAIGHSMGGDSTALLAATAPERVRAAVLEDPSFRQGNQQRTPEQVRQMQAEAAEERAKSKEELIAIGKAELTGWDERVLEPWAEAKRQISPLVFEWLLRPRTPWQEYVAKLRVPTLIVTGDSSMGAIINTAVAEELHTLAPGIAISAIANAGHCVRYQQPERFLEVVQRWLAEQR